jgi:lipopolysaccharide transport system ATP-binding protein
MSRDLAVRLKDISKSYVVYADPKYWLADFVGFGRLLKEEKHYRSLWALRDINLEIPKGGKFALIGRNGAGKSTLLRIISENIAPTTGTVQVSGRCEALMQLGTGFTPDFTGRENVHRALAYMGFTGGRAEEKFLDIVDFSEACSTSSRGFGSRSMPTTSTASMIRRRAKAAATA